MAALFEGFIFSIINQFFFLLFLSHGDFVVHTLKLYLLYSDFKDCGKKLINIRWCTRAEIMKGTLLVLLLFEIIH